MAYYRPDGDYHFIVPDHGSMSQAASAMQAFGQPDTMYYIGVRDGSRPPFIIPQSADCRQDFTLEAFESPRGPDITNPGGTAGIFVANSKETIIRGLTVHNVAQFQNRGSSACLDFRPNNTTNSNGIVRVFDCHLYDAPRAINGFMSACPLFHAANNRAHDTYSMYNNGHIFYLDQGYYGDSYNGSNANLSAIIEGNYFYYTNNKYNRASGANYGHMLKCFIPNASIRYNYFSLTRSVQEYDYSAIVDLWACGDQEVYGNGFYISNVPIHSGFNDLPFVNVHKRRDGGECVQCWEGFGTMVYAYNSVWDDDPDPVPIVSIKYSDLSTCTPNLSSLVIKNNLHQGEGAIFVDGIGDAASSSYDPNDNQKVTFDDFLLNIDSPPDSVAFDGSQLEEGGVNQEYSHVAALISRTNITNMGMYADTTAAAVIDRTLTDDPGVSDNLSVDVSIGTAVKEGEWTLLEPTHIEVPENRPYSGIVAGNNGYIYFWGGAHQTHPANEVDRFNISTEVWDRVTTEESWEEIEPIGIGIEAVDAVNLTVDVLSEDWNDQITVGNNFWLGPVNFLGNPKNTGDGYLFNLDSTELLATTPEKVRLHVSLTQQSSLDDVTASGFEVVVHPPSVTTIPWTHLSFKEKWNLVAAMYGGWQGDYVTPLGRPVTKHIYQQIVEHNGKIWLNNAGFWSWDPSLGDSTDPNSWQRHTAPPVNETQIHIWNLTVDPVLDQLVVFGLYGGLNCYVYDEAADSWTTVSLSNNSLPGSWSIVQSAYDVNEAKHLVYLSEVWRLVDLGTNSVTIPSTPPFDGSWNGNFSIEWSPELDKFLILAKVSGAIQLWTYEIASDSWVEIALGGTPPPDASRIGWDRLERDPVTGKYVFLAYQTDAQGETPDTYVFTLSSASGSIFRRVTDNAEVSDSLDSSLVESSPPFTGTLRTLSEAPGLVLDENQEVNIDTGPKSEQSSEELRTITVAYSLPTAAGTYDFTTPDLNGITPKAVMLVGTKTTFLNGDEGEDDLDHWGVADGTNQYAVSAVEVTGSNFNDCDRSMQNDSCLMYTNTHGPYWKASFDQFLSTTDTGTDETGVRLTLSASLPEQYVIIITFYAGSDIEVAAGASSIPNTGTVTANPGFAADVAIFASSSMLSFATGGQDYLFSQGWAVNDGTTNGDMVALASGVEGGVAASRHRQFLTVNGCVAEVTTNANSYNWIARTTNWTSTGFDLEAYDGSPGGAYTVWLAIKWGGFAVKQIIQDILSTDSGATDLNGYGFKPQTAIAITSRTSALEIVGAGSNSSCEGWSFLDSDGNFYGYSSASEQAAATVGNTSYTGLVNHIAGDGDSFTAGFNLYTDDGIEVDITNQADTDIKIPVLAFEEPIRPIFNVSLNDGVGVADHDEPSDTLDRIRGDSGVGVSDLANFAESMVRVLLDPGLSPSDRISELKEIVRDLADSVPIGDAFQTVSAFFPYLIDHVGIDDHIRRTIAAKVFSVILSDAVGVGDETQASREALRRVLDTIGATDAQRILPSLARYLEDSGVESEDHTFHVDTLLTRLADDLDIGDGTVARVLGRTLFRLLEDVVETDDLGEFPILAARFMADTIGVDDREQRLLVVFRALTDAGMGVSEAIARSAEVERLLADLVEVGYDKELEKTISILVSRVILSDVTTLNIVVDVHTGDGT